MNDGMVKPLYYEEIHLADAEPCVSGEDDCVAVDGDGAGLVARARQGRLHAPLLLAGVVRLHLEKKYTVERNIPVMLRDFSSHVQIPGTL